MPKILVIADDFTGAAEIGGIAHQFGLSVSILNVLPGSVVTNTEDVIILDTNTRSLDPAKAHVYIIDALKKVDLSGYDLVYKKVDSVLRGPIASELKALMTLTNSGMTVLIPANPSKGRTIKQGKYYINNVPIHQTDFKNDPEYPRNSEEVKKMIVDAGENLLTGKLNVEYGNKVVIPDVYLLKHFKSLVRKLGDKKFLPAGGADFFRSIMEERLGLSRVRTYSYGYSGSRKHLVTGSRHQQSDRAIADLTSQGSGCFFLPEKVLKFEAIYDDWFDKIKIALMEGREIIVARPERYISNNQDTKNITNLISRTFTGILEYCSPGDEIFLEGGETASSSIRKMKDVKLLIKEVVADGVVKFELSHPKVYVIVKPGSYPWPKEILTSGV